MIYEENIIIDLHRFGFRTWQWTKDYFDDPKWHLPRRSDKKCVEVAEKKLSNHRPSSPRRMIDG